MLTLLRLHIHVWILNDKKSINLVWKSKYCVSDNMEGRIKMNCSSVKWIMMIYDSKVEAKL